MDRKIAAFMQEIQTKHGVNTGLSAMDTAMLRTELRDACEANVCGQYGACYTCPPHIGSAADCIARISRYTRFIAFQKIYTLEDSFDYEGMVAGQKNFKTVITAVAGLARSTFEDPLVLGAGGCMLCETCAAKTGEACRFPEKALSSLEAHCIQVSELAARCGMKYINGPNTVTYFGGVFLK